MKKLDPRIARTRQALADSLVTLALERGYESLTIKMVTEHAGVGNRTFYRHFLSLDDLLLQVMTKAFQELKRRALLATDPRGETLAMYAFIRDHPDVLRLYVNLPWSHPARQAIVSEAAQIMEFRYAQQNRSSVPQEVSISYLIQVTNYMVSWYLDHFEEYAPEQAADVHDELVVKALESGALELRDDWMQARHQFR